MGNRYTVTRSATPANVTDDILTLKAAANRRIRLLAVYANGKGASSAPQGLRVSRVTTVGVTPGGALTPDKADHADQPAAAFTAPTTWATQPVVNAHGVSIGWNALGGMAQWQATQLTRGQFEARNSEEISIRPGAGTTPQLQEVTAVVEED